MEDYIGEIRMFGGRFAPTGWAFCDGRELQIQENELLFSLIGTTYGGDGWRTFALPDMRGRVPVGPDANLPLGGKEGTETVTLSPSHLPAHTHALSASSIALGTNPQGNLPATLQADGYGIGAPVGGTPSSSVGSNHPHENVAPSLVVSFIICLEGHYPTLDY